MVSSGTDVAAPRLDRQVVVVALAGAGAVQADAHEAKLPADSPVRDAVGDERGRQRLTAAAHVEAASAATASDA